MGRLTFSVEGRKFCLISLAHSFIHREPILYDFVKGFDPDLTDKLRLEASKLIGKISIGQFEKLSPEIKSEMYREIDEKTALLFFLTMLYIKNEFIEFFEKSFFHESVPDGTPEGEEEEGEEKISEKEEGKKRDFYNPPRSPEDKLELSFVSNQVGIFHRYLNFRRIMKALCQKQQQPELKEQPDSKKIEDLETSLEDPEKTEEEKNAIQQQISFAKIELLKKELDFLHVTYHDPKTTEEKRTEIHPRLVELMSYFTQDKFHGVYVGGECVIDILSRSPHFLYDLVLSGRTTLEESEIPVCTRVSLVPDPSVPFLYVFLRRDGYNQYVKELHANETGCGVQMMVTRGVLLKGLERVEEKIDLVNEEVKEVKKRVDNVEKEVKKGFDRMDKRFDRMEKRFDLVEKRFDLLFKMMIEGFGKGEKSEEGEIV